MNLLENKNNNNNNSMSTNSGRYIRRRIAADDCNIVPINKLNLNGYNSLHVHDRADQLSETVYINGSRKRNRDLCELSSKLDT